MKRSEIARCLARLAKVEDQVRALAQTVAHHNARIAALERER